APVGTRGHGGAHHAAPGPRGAAAPAGSQSGLMRVVGSSAAAAPVAARLVQPGPPASAMTYPPASTRPIVTGARPRRTTRCQCVSRNRSQKRKAPYATAQDGPKVASALAIAVGIPPIFQPIKLIIRIMFGPGIACTTAK